MSTGQPTAQPPCVAVSLYTVWGRFLNWFTWDNLEYELKRLVRYPLATAQVLLYCLIAWGVVGAELGAGELFWDEWWWAQLCVGFGTCWLFGTVLYITILLLPPRNLPGLADDSESSFWYGCWPSLYPSPNPGVRMIGARVLTWLVGLLALIYGLKLVLVLTCAQPIEADATSARDLFAAQWYGIPFVVGYASALLLGAYVSHRADVSGRRVRTARAAWLRRSFDRPEVRVPTSPERVRAEYGDGTSLPGSFVMRMLEARERGTAPPVTPGPDTAAALDNLWTLLQLHAIALTFARIIGLFLFGVVLPTFGGWQLISPVYFITLFLIALNVTGGLIVFRFPYYRLAALGSLAYLIGANIEQGVAVPYMFLGIGACAVLFRLPYAAPIGVGVMAFLTARSGLVGDPNPDNLAGNVWAVLFVCAWLALAAYCVYRYKLLGWAALGAFFALNHFGCQTYPMTHEHIGNYDSLLPLGGESYDGYRANRPTDGHPLITAEALLSAHGRQKPNAGEGAKPRLVVVATSGGGIRAAVWTAVVLEGLERELANLSFRDRVRVITGASGGMAGATAYAARDATGDYAPVRDPSAHDAATGLRPLAATLARDSLSPVAQTMIVRDFTWNALFPNRYTSDRGRTLEDAWDHNFIEKPDLSERGDPFLRFAKSPFARPLRELRAGEAATTRPALVFAPIMVEDTKRLLVSNLDLDELTRPTAPRLDARDAGVAGRVRGKFVPAPLALPAVEFFRLFPGATRFRVGSAARMSASFPVVSPAVPLPTDPVRRVVDAGYFDNYGIDVLTSWLLVNRQWVEKHTSGVLLVQVRAYPLEEGGRRFPNGSESALELLVGAVSAPLDAVMTARGWSAYHRNNQQLAEVDRVFNGGAKERPFFATTVFELQQDAALSWYLTTAQKRQIAEGFYKKGDNGAWAVRGDVSAQIKAVRNWFTTP